MVDRADELRAEWLEGKAPRRRDGGRVGAGGAGAEVIAGARGELGARHVHRASTASRREDRIPVAERSRQGNASRKRAGSGAGETGLIRFVQPTIGQVKRARFLGAERSTPVKSCWHAPMPRSIAAQ